MSMRRVATRIAVGAAVVVLVVAGVASAPAGADKPSGRGKPQPASATSELSTAAYLQPPIGWTCWFDWTYLCFQGPTGPHQPGWRVGARLTSSGEGVAGAAISIVGDPATRVEAAMCSGVTNADGYVGCFVPYAVGVAHSPGGAYEAVFAGGAGLPPARAVGTMSRWCSSGTFPYVFDC